jgi:hypothetical protein
MKKFAAVLFAKENILHILPTTTLYHVGTIQVRALFTKADSSHTLDVFLRIPPEGKVFRVQEKD